MSHVTKVEHKPHYYPHYKEADLKGLIGTYNSSLECFRRTGIPDLLAGLTRIPMRSLEVFKNPTHLVVQHVPDLDWQKGFEEAFKLKGWLYVNEIPHFYSSTFNGALVNINLLQGLGVPWPEQGVRALSLTYHRGGFLKYSDEDKTLVSEIGSKDPTLGMEIRQALYDQMWPVQQRIKLKTEEVA